MNYQETLEEIVDLSKNHTIVSGEISIEKVISEFSNIKIETLSCRSVDWFYHVMGTAPDEMVEESLLHETFKEDTIEGHYSFKAILKYEPPEYGEFGRPISRDYWEVCHIEINLLETFVERQRNQVLTELLDDDTDDFLGLFNQNQASKTDLPV